MRTQESRPADVQVLQSGAAAVVPAVQDVIAFRVGQYRPAEPAVSPLAEGPGLVVLTNNFVWPAQGPEQKLRSVAVMRDLMLQAMTTANNMPQSSEERVLVLELIRRIGSAYEAVSGEAQAGGAPQHPELNRAANKLRNISTRSSPAVLLQAVNEVRDAVAKAYPNLPEPQLSTRPPGGEQPGAPAAAQN